MFTLPSLTKNAWRFCFFFLVEINFTLGPIFKILFLFFDTGLLFPRIWATLATFKAGLMAVDMTKCFGGPRIILHAH